MSCTAPPHALRCSNIPGTNALVLRLALLGTCETLDFGISTTICVAKCYSAKHQSLLLLDPTAPVRGPQQDSGSQYYRNQHESLFFTVYMLETDTTATFF